MRQHLPVRVNAIQIVERPIYVSTDVGDNNSLQFPEQLSYDIELG